MSGTEEAFAGQMCSRWFDLADSVTQGSLRRC
jgi:hypothetical protein